MASSFLFLPLTTNSAAAVVGEITAESDRSSSSGDSERKPISQKLKKEKERRREGRDGMNHVALFPFAIRHFPSFFFPFQRLPPFSPLKVKTAPQKEEEDIQFVCVTERERERERRTDPFVNIR